MSIKPTEKSHAMETRVRRHPLGYLEAIDKPDPEALRTYYAERYYQEGKGNYRPSYPPSEVRYLEAKVTQKRERIAAIRGGSPGRFLDIGCGEGFTLSHFRRVGWEVEGLDYSETGMAAMNPECLDALETGDVMSLVGRKLGTGKKYDVVCLTNVLEHLPDPPGLMRQVHGLVVPGGVVVITVPNDFSIYQQYLLDTGHVDQLYWVALPDHLAYFDRSSLLGLSNATGWHCHDILADFPIDWFLLHPGSNYVRDRALGKAAHRARVEFENLLSQQSVSKINAFYRAMADVGFGRDLTAFLSPVTK